VRGKKLREFTRFPQVPKATAGEPSAFNTWASGSIFQSSRESPCLDLISNPDTTIFLPRGLQQNPRLLWASLTHRGEWGNTTHFMGLL